MSINHENQITGAIMLYSYKCIPKWNRLSFHWQKYCSNEFSFHVSRRSEKKFKIRAL